MLRNIPNKIDQSTLKSILDETSYGKYDFAYLRIDFSNDCNVGYAFVNFIDVSFCIFDRILLTYLATSYNRSTFRSSLQIFLLIFWSLLTPEQIKNGELNLLMYETIITNKYRLRYRFRSQKVAEVSYASKSIILVFYSISLAQLPQRSKAGIV